MSETSLQQDTICILCQKNIVTGSSSDVVVLGTKGCAGINKASSERNSSVHANVGQKIHKVCRQRWCNPKYIASGALNVSVDEAASVSRLRSKETFDFKSDCIFCGTSAQCGDRRRSCDTYPVRTSVFEDTIVSVCRDRGDEWSEAVMGRLSYAHDLHAEDAIYHQQCSINFRTGKDVPKRFEVGSEKTGKKPKLSVGRPLNRDKREAFKAVIQLLADNEDEQLSISDLVEKMGGFLRSAHSLEEPYGPQYMKQKLQEHFGDQIIFTNLEGRENVVTFMRTAASILHDYYRKPKSLNEEEETRWIVKTAAKLIKNDIRALEPLKDYPGPDDLTAEYARAFLPDSVNQFLEIIVTGKHTERKQASLGHALVQAARPRKMIAPLQLGLAAQMHHHFGSRFLIDSLHQHGFCSSYEEVQMFEQSAAVTSQTSVVTRDMQFIQYAADNVDHNIHTLDGHGTFHGMGMVATLTPGKFTSNNVPRRSVTASEIKEAGQVKIQHYSYPKGQKGIQFRELEMLRSCIQVTEPTHILDAIWTISPFLQWPRPGWSGFMQMVQTGGSHPGKSSVTFLPIIDLNPGDMTCVYSTLLFLAEQAKQSKTAPVITFDQPLWWKAQTIVANEPPTSVLKSVILRIGGLHTEMSYLGCIGRLMENSGLSEVLEVVYGSNTVAHMLSGKAVARARRGHFLVTAALNILLTADALGLPLPEVESEVETMSDDVPTVVQTDPVASAEAMDTDVDTVESMSTAKQMLTQLLTNPDWKFDDKSKSAVMTIHDTLENEKEKNISSRTSCLWLQYMKMIDILKRFLRAERTGNWTLHLAALYEMLPYFAAAGHNLYARTTYLYLQQMSTLATDQPEIHTLFMEGYHVVRRSDRFWAGLSTDLIIEQMLMRSLKTTGGLTRGRGMTELQRLVWVKSLPACSELNQAMQKFTEVTYDTSEQHKEASDTRQKRDCEDTDKLVRFLQERNPFSKIDQSLRSITSGVVADTNVNADQAESVGQKILQSMEGQDVMTYSFKRKQQAVTLGCKTAVTINKEAVHIDPQALFQRLTVVAADEDVDTQQLFAYELCSYPTALFDSTGSPRPANKAALATALWKYVESQEDTLPSELIYVLDGGALLHRILWPRGVTFQDICNTYAQYVLQKYGKCVVVFDGYTDEPSVKDMTHLRRGTSTIAVHCESHMRLTLKKDDFLCNKKNKQRFLHLLGSCLEAAGCQCIHARGDADRLIVETAVAVATDKDVVVVADDTDILVLLCHHMDSSRKKIFMKPEARRGTFQRIWDVGKLKLAMGQSLTKNLPFVHAILGCDTTSRLFSIGKPTGLKKYKQLKESADMFSRPDLSAEDVIRFGEKAIVVLYGGKREDNLDILRFRRFTDRIAKNAISVELKTLPPSSAAAKYHSLRVYYQVQVWLGNDQLQATEWGWQESNGVLAPVMTDKPPAPERLLNLIRCNCKTDCSTSRCTCRKHGLDCSQACGECHGTACANSPAFEEDTDETEDDMA